jgi:hypothetical protein
MDAEGAVTYELRGRVAWVGLNRPRKRNAINDALLGELLAAARRAQEEARALVVFGHGPCFCAGLDLAEHRAREPAEVFHHSRSWHAAFSVLRRGRIPRSRRCTAPPSAAGWSSPPPATCAWPTPRPSSRCRRARAASTWAAARPCTSRG